MGLLLGCLLSDFFLDMFKVSTHVQKLGGQKNIQDILEIVSPVKILSQPSLMSSSWLLQMDNCYARMRRSSQVKLEVDRLDMWTLPGLLKREMHQSRSFFCKRTSQQQSSGTTNPIC